MKSTKSFQIVIRVQVFRLFAFCFQLGLANLLLDLLFPDSDFEIASKSQGVCVHTHNKEVLRCKSGETVSRR